MGFGYDEIKSDFGFLIVFRDRSRIVSRRLLA